MRTDPVMNLIFKYIIVCLKHPDQRVGVPFLFGLVLFEFRFIAGDKYQEKCDKKIPDGLHAEISSYHRRDRNGANKVNDV